MPRYRIEHQTKYRREFPAMAAWQSLHLRPREEANQTCGDFELEILPSPPDLAEQVDYFGNVRHYFTLREPHRELTVTSRSVVEREELAYPMAGLTPPLSRGGALLNEAVLAGEFEVEQYRHSSPRVPILAAAAAIADGLDADDPPLLTWIERLGEQFKTRFKFDPTATDVSTPISEMLEKGRGVCQDFAHLFLSCVRSRGLAGAYVSGYLVTEPPPGKPRLVGADASHAWVSVYVPTAGWIDYDPTNHALVSGGHIVTARGRDYSDVSPIKGVYSGAGGHTLTTAVTVTPE